MKPGFYFEMMNWFEGDIANAITKCKSEDSVLLVYIFKESDGASQEMDNVWQSASIAKMVSSSKCVALKLEVNSTGGKQFAQIYPVLMIPSIYFIQSNGVPLETVAGKCTLETLEEKVRASLKPRESSDKGETSTTPSTSAGASAAPKEDDKEESGEIGAAVNTDHTMSPEDKEAKIQRAKELIRQKQMQKEQEQKEKAKNEELERRQLGRGVNKLREFQAEQEAKEVRDSLKKEKEETRLAREKIREQIQQDREARAAKYQKDKAEKEEALRQKQQEKLQKEAEEAAKLTAANSTNARLQFKFPDGSSVTQTFDADVSLGAARNFVASYENNPLGANFRLAVIYPRRVFTHEEYLESTMREAGLVPSSALMVLPPAQSDDSVTPGAGAMTTSSGILDTVMAPFLYIWNFIYAFVFGTPSNQSGGDSANSQSTTASQQNKPESSSSATPGQDGARRRIGRLSDMPRDGDDQNTWNGNSTQQM